MLHRQQTRNSLGLQHRAASGRVFRVPYQINWHTIISQKDNKTEFMPEIHQITIPVPLIAFVKKGI